MYQLKENSSVHLSVVEYCFEIIIDIPYHKNQLFSVSPRVGTSWSVVKTQDITVMEGQRVVVICRIPTSNTDATFMWFKIVSDMIEVIDS